MINRCAYCNRTPEEQLASGDKYAPSVEHILPESLTGRLPNNPFELEGICAFCNNVAGMFFDAPAVRNWFIHMKISQHATDFLKIEDGPVVPIKYMGVLEGITFETKQCDFWLGPAGDPIYHFHEPYPSLDSHPAMVGVHPSLKKTVDKGFAFLFVRSNNPLWHKTILYSFVETFHGSQVFLGNGKKPAGPTFSEIPEHLKKLLSELQKLNGKNHKCQNTISVDGENRFLAKVALGIGAKFLGPGFTGSPMAILLRDYIWTRDLEKRKLFHIHGTNFTSPGKNREELSEFFGMEGAIVLTLMNLHDCVSLSLCIFNSYTAMLKIEKAEDNFKEQIGNGITFVIVPGLKKVIGPMNQMHFLQHKLEMGSPNEELAKLMQRMSIKQVQPPIMI